MEQGHAPGNMPRVIGFTATVALASTKPGVLIGRRGCNIKGIQQEVGEDVQLEFPSGQDIVVVHGRNECAVEAAAKMLEEQITKPESRISPTYPRPWRVDTVLLCGSYGPMPRAVGFERRTASDEAARSTRRKECLYVMAPALGPAEPMGMLAGMQRPASIAAAILNPRWASLGDVAAGYYGAGALRRNGPVAKAIAGAAQAAAAREDLSLRRLKLRFNLGKQFFFNLHPSAGHVPLDQLQELGSRHEFCNTVPSHRVRALVELLTGPAGFRKVGEKYSTSAHVVNERLNAKFIIGLDTSAPRVTVTKVSTSPLRAHYTALLGGPSQLDLRLKLHGYGVPTHDSMAQPAAQAVVAACNAIGIEAFAESAGDVHLPVGMRLATFRRKHKEIYEGAFRVGNKTVPLKISIKTLRDGKGGPRTEVSGTLPAANADLAELLAAARRRGGGGEEQAEGGAGGERCGTAWWAAVLRAVAAFAEAVNAQG